VSSLNNAVVLRDTVVEFFFAFQRERRPSPSLCDGCQPRGLSLAIVTRIERTHRLTTWSDLAPARL